MPSKNSTPKQTRDDKALDLIRANAVQLFAGRAGERGYALVKGSGRVTYVVSHDGCSCPDAAKRDPKGCKHALAVRWLCEGYRQHRARQAPLSPILMAALAAYHAEQEAAQAAPAELPPRPRLVIDGEVHTPTFVTTPTRLPRSDRPDPEAA